MADSTFDDELFDIEETEEYDQYAAEIFTAAPKGIAYFGDDDFEPDPKEFEDISREEYSAAANMYDESGEYSDEYVDFLVAKKTKKGFRGFVEGLFSPKEKLEEEYEEESFNDYEEKSKIEAKSSAEEDYYHPSDLDHPDNKEEESWVNAPRVRTEANIRRQRELEALRSGTGVLEEDKTAGYRFFERIFNSILGI